MSEAARRFHSREELFFERRADGSVLVDPRRIGPVELDASTWASVVASMSAEGENGETWRAALDRQVSPVLADQGEKL